MKVNMTPNPLDVVTIHASQGDTEARQWEFELHNNGELIDTSEITEQLFFKAYKGGTEQILPENTSTPTTSPFKGDIKYPQGLLTDQEFTYRQSPTEEDGLAKITDIKGNTIVWNQLVHGEFGSNYTDYWSVYRGTGSVSNGELTVTDAVGRGGIRLNTNAVLPLVVNHKYFISLQYKSTVNLETHFVVPAIKLPLSSSYKTYSSIETHTGVEVTKYIDTFPEIVGETGTFSIKNVMCFDLTQMGLDSMTDPSDFTSLFPLPYYAYNQGTLLSFMGNGIKTVGKNLFDEQIELGTIDANGNNSAATNRWRSKNYIPCFPNTRYVFSKNGVRQNVNFKFYDADKNYLYNDIGGSAITTPSNAHYLRFFYNDEINVSSGLQLEFGTTPSSYEPYASSTSSLPISTYFPTGMKSAGTVYDELTPRKAITRIGAVDLGSLDWGYNSTYGMYSTGISELVKKPSASNIKVNAISTVGTLTDWATFFASGTSSGLWAINTGGYLGIATTETNSTTFKNNLQGVYLYYELATPTETDVDLDLSYRSYLNGTEQLLPVNGSVPSTSPIIADMTYLSIDDAMEYILEKLANVPQNTQQILESLEDDVADLQTDTSALQTNVSGLQTSVGNINTNIGQLSSTVAGHTASISGMQSDISDLNTGLSDLEDTVTDDTSRIGTLETGLATTNGNVQNLETSVSDLDDTVTAQGTTVTALNSIISDISNNPVLGSLGNHELGFVAAYADATLPANTGTRVTIPRPTIFPNNYTPLFIVGMSTGSYNVSICEIPHTFGNSDSVKCRVWNHGGEQTTQITVYILCMRQRQSQ